MDGVYQTFTVDEYACGITEDPISPLDLPAGIQKDGKIQVEFLLKSTYGLNGFVKVNI